MFSECYVLKRKDSATPAFCDFHQVQHKKPFILEVPPTPKQMEKDFSEYDCIQVAVAPITGLDLGQPL